MLKSSLTGRKQYAAVLKYAFIYNVKQRQYKTSHKDFLIIKNQVIFTWWNLFKWLFGHTWARYNGWMIVLADLKWNLMNSTHVLLLIDSKGTLVWHSHAMLTHIQVSVFAIIYPLLHGETPEVRFAGWSQSFSKFGAQWPRKLKMLLWGPFVCAAGLFSLQTLFAAGFTAPTGPLFFITWGSNTKSVFWRTLKILCQQLKYMKKIIIKNKSYFLLLYALKEGN